MFYNYFLICYSIFLAYKIMSKEILELILIAIVIFVAA
jgi:hypothetical protein